MEADLGLWKDYSALLFLLKQNLKKTDKTQKAVIYLELINWTAIA